MLVVWNSNNRVNKNLFYLSTFFTFSILAFRNIDVGGDTFEYVKLFLKQGSLYDNIEIEKGYVLFNDILYFISESKFWFIFATSFITMAPFYYIIYKYTQGNKILPLCIYMSMWQLLGCSMTSLRQNIAISIAMLVFILLRGEHLKNRNIKIIVPIALIMLSFTFHSTMYVVVPIMIATYFVKLNKKIAILCIVGCVISSLILKNLAGDFFTLFNMYTNSLVGFEHMTYYYGNDKYELYDNISFFSLAPHALMVCCLIYLANNEELNKYEFKCLFVAECIYLLGVSFPLIFRVVLCLYFIGITAIPQAFRVPNKGHISIKCINYLIICLCLFFMYLRYKVYETYDYSTGGGGGNLLPYTFIWE